MRPILANFISDSEGVNDTSEDKEVLTDANNNNNNSNILYLSQRGIKAVVRSYTLTHNEESAIHAHISIIQSHDTHTRTHL